MVSRRIDKLLQSKIKDMRTPTLNHQTFIIEAKAMDLQLAIEMTLLIKKYKIKSNSIKIGVNLAAEITKLFQINNHFREMNGRRILVLFIIREKIKTNLYLRKDLNLLHQ
jgi:hypothetical protein